MIRLAAMDGVMMEVVDMCALGMRVDSGPVQVPARKRTKMMSNSHEVLKRVKVTCPNLGSDTSRHHVHVPLEQGRARRCQIYPK